uniref:Uncharacterized protein n=1 Tax=Oryza brachyantha TaxID=4533 RepID=J3M345_ORYBR
MDPSSGGGPNSSGEASRKQGIPGRGGSPGSGGNRSWLRQTQRRAMATRARRGEAEWRWQQAREGARREGATAREGRSGTDGDGAFGKLHAEGAAEVFADSLEHVVPLVIVGVGVGGRGSTEKLLAAACLVLVGEGVVALDGADGGDELAGTPGGEGSRGRGRGVGGAVGAGGASEEVDLGRGGGVAEHADAIAVAGEVRHGG